MRFFIPNLKDDSKANEVWEQVRRWVSNNEDKNWQATDRRIFRIQYRHDGQSWIAEVGRPHPEDGREQVYAIFDTFGRCYYVCTENRGVLRGGPYLIGKGDADSVEDFASES
jgi:hypothetical protein